MATTYERIRVVVRHLESHPNEKQVDRVAREIRRRRLGEFRLRGPGTALEDFISEASLVRLLRLMSDLGLVKIEGGNLNFRTTDFAFARSDTTYARKVDLATKNLLADKGVSLESVQGVIKSIRPPQVPDAPTIHEALGSRAEGIGEEMFARLLFLLACAGVSLTRTIHIHYQID